MSGYLPARLTFCRTDFNADGATDFADAAELFIRWGMTWGEIGPKGDPPRIDLDDDGSITTGDLSLLLLDMGPCYSNAASNPPEDSTSYMLKDEPAPMAPQSR
jgi:hypothetical protein